MRVRSRGPRFTFLVSAVLVVVIGLGWLLISQSMQRPSLDPMLPPKGVPAAEKSEVYLYYGDLQGRFLKAEQRVMNRSSDDVVFGRQLIDALVRGPHEEGRRTLPEKARLRALFITSGTAYVDFESDAFEEHPGGVETELLSIYAIVNTLVVNVEAIQTVKILIGGRERPTLAGHVDLQQYFVADMMWIR